MIQEEGSLLHWVASQPHGGRFTFPFRARFAFETVQATEMEEADPPSPLLYEQLALFPPDISPLCAMAFCPVRDYSVDAGELQLQRGSHESLPEIGELHA